MCVRASAARTACSGSTRPGRGSAGALAPPLLGDFLTRKQPLSRPDWEGAAQALVAVLAASAILLVRFY